MARAKVSEVEVKPAVPAVVQKTVTLTLTEEEANHLAAVSGATNVGSVLAYVFDALYNAGFTGDDYRVNNAQGQRTSVRVVKR